MESFLFQATIYLATAVIAVPIAARLGLGSVLGYLAAGIIVGPVLGLVGDEAHDLRHFAEFGVVMMLFLIGLELDPGALWDMRHRLLGLGGLQIAMTTLAIGAGASALGQPQPTALAIGLILALSSTAIVLQTLSEKGLMQTSGGRAAFSVLLTQDIAVVPALALLPLLAVARGPELAPDGSIQRPGLGGGETAEPAALSLVEGLPAWGVTLVTLGAVAAVIVAGVYLARPLFRYIHAAHLREMYTALALLIVVGIAFLMNLVGLSPALGTFLAGVVLANSEFRHELRSDIEPFKGLLLGLFFITVGAGINPAALFREPLLILGLTLGLTAIKSVVLLVLGRVFGLRGRSLWLFTFGLAQAGEFGFVLVAFSLQQSVLDVALGERLLLVIALSMLAAPLAFMLLGRLTPVAPDARAATPYDSDIGGEGEIIIAGIGRFGQVVNRMVQMAGVKATVLDHDLKTVQLMRRFGFKGYYGDPSRPDLLLAAGLREARVLVAAMDDRKAVTRVVSHARRECPDLHIVARARDRGHVFELYRAGADDIVRELFDSSLRAGRYVLENIGISEFEAAALEKSFYQMDRESLKDLAELWSPTVPLDSNPAYVERAHELDKDLETALMVERDPEPDPAAPADGKKDGNVR